MTPDAFKDALCRLFCTEVHVGEVPAGLAFSLPIRDEIGDRIGAYLMKDRGAPYLADDGMFLGELEARGIDPLRGSRREFLDRTLRSAGAYIDDETLEIRTHPMEDEPDVETVVRFLSALSTARAVQFWTREVVRSTFIEDATAEFRRQFENVAEVLPHAAAATSLTDFPADILLKPRGEGLLTAVYLVQNLERLTEALLLKQESRIRLPGQMRVTALVEDLDTLPRSHRAQRVINRIDGVTYYRADEAAAVEKIGQIAQLPAAA